MTRVHRYAARCSWVGSTGVGYDHYDRTHQVSAEPSLGGLPVSADPAFGGDPMVANPEVLLVVAAASCQLLSLLAVAARARIDVVAYEDDAVAVMPTSDPPLRITQIHLRPQITVAGEASEERLAHLVEVAHRECFIANSLRSEIVIEPTFLRA